MKKTWTTKSLFEEINSILKENGLLPSILDYGTGPFHDYEILNNEFYLHPEISFGCEGIYLDLHLFGDIGYGESHHSKYDLGTYKTLCSDKDAYRDMAILQTEFVFAYMDIMHNYSDEFIHQGYKVDFVDIDGSTWYGIYIMDDTGYEERLMIHVKGFSKSSRDRIHACKVYSNDTGELVNEIELNELLEPLS